MNYIVLDLEWNQSPEGREQENPQIPFEILQIGAVKLDRDLNVTDQFCERIRPVVYPEIHYKIQEILRLNPGRLPKRKNVSASGEGFFFLVRSLTLLLLYVGTFRFNRTAAEFEVSRYRIPVFISSVFL